MLPQHDIVLKHLKQKIAVLMYCMGTACIQTLYFVDSEVMSGFGKSASFIVFR
jgi:hypothetical protein